MGKRKNNGNDGWNTSIDWELKQEKSKITRYNY